MRVNKRSLIQFSFAAIAMGVAICIAGWTLNGFSWNTEDNFESPWYQTIHINQDKGFGFFATNDATVSISDDD
ncbi:hypothetical protein [Enterococcus sp. LJL90]